MGRLVSIGDKMTLQRMVEKIYAMNIYLFSADIFKHVPKSVFALRDICFSAFRPHYMYRFMNKWRMLLPLMDTHYVKIRGWYVNCLWLYK